MVCSTKCQMFAGMTELNGTVLRQTRNRRQFDSVGFVVNDVTLKIVDLETNKALGHTISKANCVSK